MDSLAYSTALTNFKYTDEQLAVMGAGSKVSLRQAPQSAAIRGVQLHSKRVLVWKYILRRRTFSI